MPRILTLCLLGWGMSLCLFGLAFAQRSTIGTQGPSVTVQLPEFHIFSVDTTVLVPDRGSAFMGGIGRSASGQTTSGAPLLPWANRSSGSSTGAAVTNVQAWIHDFQAMDEALLAVAAKRRGANGSDAEADPKLAGASAEPALLSAAEYERRNALQAEAQQSEARQHFEKAQSLAAAGKLGAARVHYQMALRRATGPLRDEVLAALRTLSGPAVARETSR